jgi:hypothetical protein
MDMTAALLVYTRRPASQVDGSGKVSRNHSWNTGGNLARQWIKTCTCARLSLSQWQDFRRKYVSTLIILYLPNLVKYNLQLWTLFLHREVDVLLLVHLHTQPFLPLASYNGRSTYRTAIVSGTH